jgi:hypothetical protein
MNIIVRRLMTMWLKKKELEAQKILIENLSKKVGRLEKENKDLKAEYSGKIAEEKSNNEYRRKLEEEAKMSAELYKKNLDALVAHDLNYAFLQQLVNTSKDPGTLIEVELRDGTKLTIRKENKKDYRKAAEDIFELSDF